MGIRYVYPIFNRLVKYYIFIEIISQGLASATVIAKVNGDLWDLDRPFEKSSSLQLIKFDDEQGI